MDKTLQHYGILGMRWGVRRTKAQLRRARGPDNGSRRVTREQYEAAKKRAINSGDKATVERWKSHLTNKELQDAIDRVDKYKRLSDIGRENVKSGWQKTKSVMDGIGDVISFAKKGLEGYEVIRKVNNTFNSKFSMPEMRGTGQQEAIKRQQEAKAQQEDAKARQEYAKARKAENEEKKKRNS